MARSSATVRSELLLLPGQPEHLLVPGWAIHTRPERAVGAGQSGHGYGRLVLGGDQPVRRFARHDHYDAARHAKFQPEHKLPRLLIVWQLQLARNSELQPASGAAL